MAETAESTAPMNYFPGAVTPIGSTHPTDIKLRRAEKTLLVGFDDGAEFSLEAEFLRVFSPSAEVQGHGPDERKVIGGARHVGIMGIETVGNYAIQLIFDDLHDSGIYTWVYLRELGETHADRWAAYEAELAQQGLSRDPG